MNSIDLLYEEKKRLLEAAFNSHEDFLNPDWKENKDTYYSQFSEDGNISDYGFETLTDFSEKFSKMLDSEELSKKVVKVCAVAYFKSKNNNSDLGNIENNNKNTELNGKNGDTVPDFVYVF